MTIALLALVALALGAGRLTLVRRVEADERRHSRWLYEYARSQSRDEWDR